MLTGTMNHLLTLTTILNISICCLAAASSSSSIETRQREHADASFLSLDPTDNDGPGGTSSVHQRIMKEDRSSWEDFISRRTSRRERGHVKVEYSAGKHPYERMMEGEVLDITQQLLDDNEQRRRTQRNPFFITDEDYVPLRMRFDTHLLDAYKESYPQHVSYLRNVLLPSLRNFWATTLNIVPTQKIEVPLDGICNREVKTISGFDLLDFLEYDTTSIARAAVPVTNMNNDVNVYMDGDQPTSIIYDNTDLVIIVLPVEGTEYCPAANEVNQMKTLAFATNCQNDQLDRPTVGYTGICFGPMDPSDRTSKTHRRRLTTVAHEFTHILGMNSYDVPYFYNPKTGKPRTARDQYNRPPQENVLCVNGIRQIVEKASSDTIMRVTTANGYIAYEVVTETVRQVARNQFGCQDLIGGRLENQPTGDDDCYGSHWDHRLYNNDFMAAVYTGSTQYVTPLTLALLEDSGWYKPNYSIAENTPFGLGAGCDFAKEECIQKGEVPKWGEEFFCNSQEAIGCTPDKHLLAYCDISRWDSNLPSGYQYYDEAADIGGGLSQMDFCPSYSTIFRFETKSTDKDIVVLDCTDPNVDNTWVELEDEVFGASSRCIDDSYGIRPMCLNVICGETGRDAGKVILETGSGKQGRCEYTGQVLRLPGGTDVICPSFAQICPQSVCPGLCSGRGECDYTQSPPRCSCFNREDTSPHCNGTSTYEFSPTISPSPTMSPEPTFGPTVAEPAFFVKGGNSGSVQGNNIYLQFACALSLVYAVLV
eukprot:scaffold26658_cov153-Skeletonema_menzelii.AAC.2